MIAIKILLRKIGSKEFFSYSELESKISDKSNLQKLTPVIESHVDEFLRVRLGKEMPMIKMFIGEKTISKLKNSFMSEIETMFPVVMKKYAENLQEEFDIGQIVREKIFGSKKLRFISWYGAILGFIIGCLQVLITWLITLAG
jgi:hypothetical protein